MESLVLQSLVLQSLVLQSLVLQSLVLQSLVLQSELGATERAWLPIVTIRPMSDKVRYSYFLHRNVIRFVPHIHSKTSCIPIMRLPNLDISATQSWSISDTHLPISCAVVPTVITNR
jgi:hypothetical protein